jgi:nitrate reductase gamma subunit
MNEQLLHFVEYELQAIALLWMAVIYTLKAVQLSRLPMPWDRAPPRGGAGAGAMHSYARIFMPWSVESSRKYPGRWAEFAIYHLAALAAIINTFTIPFAPQLLTPPVRMATAALIALAIPIGFFKLVRRISRPELRVISTPDDYFSLISLQLFFFSGVMVLLYNTPFWRMTYFLVTAAFLFYVPFSKISHYIYYFFAHALTGSRYGWRGVTPREGAAR